MTLTTNDFLGLPFHIHLQEHFYSLKGCNKEGSHKKLRKYSAKKNLEQEFKQVEGIKWNLGHSQLTRICLSSSSQQTAPAISIPRQPNVDTGCNFV